jgi:hypothetical protein
MKRDIYRGGGFFWTSPYKSCPFWTAPFHKNQNCNISIKKIIFNVILLHNFPFCNFFYFNKFLLYLERLHTKSDTSDGIKCRYITNKDCCHFWNCFWDWYANCSIYVFCKIAMNWNVIQQLNFQLVSHINFIIWPVWRELFVIKFH